MTRTGVGDRRLKFVWVAAAAALFRLHSARDRHSSQDFTTGMLARRWSHSRYESPGAAPVVRAGERLSADRP